MSMDPLGFSMFGDWIITVIFRLKSCPTEGYLSVISSNNANFPLTDDK